MSAGPTRVVVVDDEPLAREKLRILLQGRPEYALVAECGDGPSAVAAIRELRPDLVFLDVEMPGFDGFDVLRHLAGETTAHVVFVTAYDQYAVRAFEVRALDYLLKPFDRERFEEALARLPAGGGTRGGAGAEWGVIQDLLDEVSERRGFPLRLAVRSGHKTILIPAGEVAWIEASGNYVTLHAGSRGYLMRETMNGVERRLDPRRFVRIHRSTIVNLDHVASVEPYFHGEYVVTMDDGKRLVASRTHSPRLREHLR